MLTKLFVTLSVITFSAMTQASTLPETDIQHDPQQCPVGMEGYYKISAASEMGFKVSRDLNNNLALQFIISGSLHDQPTIAHGRYVPVNSIRSDGTPYVIGRSVAYCKDSAVYSQFISSDETEIESNTVKMTVSADGLQVQQVAPVVSEPELWPRDN